MGTAPSSTATVVLLVGPGTDGLLRDLDALPNVDARPGTGPGAHSSASTYLLHDADPLEHVANAWIEFFEDRATHGALDVEIETALGVFRRGEAALPDYYVVLEPESAPANWKHWWLGVLPHAAPARVLPSSSDPGAVRRLLGRLPQGRPFPDPASWLPDVRFSVPDRIGLV